MADGTIFTVPRDLPAMNGEQIRTALWLTPRPGTPLHDALQQTITGLSSLFDDAPRFAPHVTLTTGIDVSRPGDVDRVLDRAAAAAKSVPYLDVVLQGLSYGTRFFRKVVLEVWLSPELLSLATVCHEMFVAFPDLVSAKPHFAALSDHEKDELHRQAVQNSRKWAADDYRPHLSLVYSQIYTVTEAMRETIEQRLKDVFGADYATKGIGWTNGRLALVNCQGDVADWQVLGYRDLDSRS